MNTDILKTRCDSEDYFGMLKNKVIEMINSDTKDPIVISFTSYREGEGVSSTITNFAHTLSQDRRCKVLLVDFNVRNPSLHKFFLKEAKSHNGNDDDSAELEDSQHNYKIIANDHLHVITTNKRNDSMPAHQNKYEIIRFFMRAKEEYNYILLDCPPLCNNNFATILASKSDYTVLVVEAHRVRTQVLCGMIKELEQLGANILGVILNKRQHPIPQFIYRML